MFEHEFQHEALRLLRQIERLLEFGKFTLTLENDMGITSITPGTPVTLTAALLLNGQPYVPPDGSTYIFATTFSTPETDAALIPAPVSGVTDEVSVEVPAGTADTTVTVGVSAIAPDGTTVSTTATLTVSAPQVFSISLG